MVCLVAPRFQCPEDMGDHLEHINIGDDASSSQLLEETPAEDVHVPPPVADMLLSLCDSRTCLFSIDLHRLLQS